MKWNPTRLTGDEVFGFLTPNGIFYPCEWHEHEDLAEALAMRFLLERKPRRDFDSKDILQHQGYAGIHSPHGFNGWFLAQLIGVKHTTKQVAVLTDWFLELSPKFTNISIDDAVHPLWWINRIICGEE